MSKLRRLLGALNDRREDLMPWFLSVWPQSAWRLLPGSSARFGPPRRTSTLAEYLASEPDASWTPAIPATPGRLPPTFVPLPRLGDFTNDTCDQPEFGVARLPGARVLDRKGWVVGRGDRFLGEFFERGNAPQSRVYLLGRAAPPRQLPGRTLHLAATWAEINFFHWMFDAIPRAEIFRRAGGDWSQVDHILLPALCTPTTLALEAALGLPPEKIIRLQKPCHLVCDELLLPGPAVSHRAHPAWVVEFHRALLSPAEPLGGERLYFPRRGPRGPYEGAALDALLLRHGFEEAAVGDFPRLRRQIAAARYIVGVHGAALTNLVYARPGARLLEIVPSTHLVRYFRGLCAGAGLDYAAIVGRSRRVWRHPSGKAPQLPFSLDLGEFSTALDALLRPSRA